MSVFSDDAELKVAALALNDASSLLMNLRMKHGISLEEATALVMIAAEGEGGVPLARVMRHAARTLSESAAATARQAAKQRPIRSKQGR